MYSNVRLSSVPADVYSCTLVCGNVQNRMVGPPGSPGSETDRERERKDRLHKRHLTSKRIIAPYRNFKRICLPHHVFKESMLLSKIICKIGSMAFLLENMFMFRKEQSRLPQIFFKKIISWTYSYQSHPGKLFFFPPPNLIATPLFSLQLQLLCSIAAIC